MKKNVLILLLFIAYSASAQLSFNTGSAQLDADLNIINARASTDFGSFKADVSVLYNIPERKIDYMHGTLNMAPGEIYFALEISKLSRTSVDHVITVYEQNKRKGWGYIAQEAGIKPGSPEFHQLKNHASSKRYTGQNQEKEKGKGKSKGKGKGKK
jgi:hypothetical protein